MAKEPTKESVLVEAPIGRVYEYWSNLENLPRLLANVERVRETGPDTTHWVVRGPLGARIEFDVRTTIDEPNSAVAWVAEEGGIDLFGEARFEELAPDLTRVEFSAGPSATRQSLKGALRRFAKIFGSGDDTVNAELADTSDVPRRAVRAGRRLPGSFEGRLVAGDDFDDPLPDDLLRGFGG